MTPFAGIPDAAFEFYTELEHNNNRDWWLAHKATYDSAVKEPLTGLLAELEPEFGGAELSGPTGISGSPWTSLPTRLPRARSPPLPKAWASTSSSTLTACSSAAEPHPHTGQLARFRSAVDAPSTGEVLQEIVAEVRAVGFTVEGETLKRSRGGSTRTIPARSC